MNDKQKLFFMLLSVLALVVPIMCGVAVAQTAAKGEFPQGTYVSGKWSVTFADENRFRVTEGGEVVVEGTYTVKGDEITLSNEQGKRACGTEVGRYRWKYDGKALALSKVEDKCEGRVKALTAQPWVKEK